ncbi:MAG: STAS/SEC14 domain-containing protein [Gammaproteobacteria bacterium]|nr:STAS/SEC14 domain-containing protein [Gammaproteobacteria bacterium]
MIEQLETGVPDIVGFIFSGKLLGEDCRSMDPCIEAIKQREGGVKLLAMLEDFHGLDWRGAWDEIRFCARHSRDFKRIAMVGDQKWEELMANFCKRFTHAEVRYFDESRTNAAWYWLREDGQ